jgi:hypothetical protein
MSVPISINITRICNLLALLLILFSTKAKAQLKEFEVLPMAQPNVAVVQANSQFPDDALVLVYSAIEGLEFRSSLGALDKISFNPSASRYELLMRPVKQMLFVAKPGYIEEKITTLNPNPKDVFYFKVEEQFNEALLAKGLVRINSEPQGCQIFINGLQLANKTPFTQEMPAGPNRITLKRERYLDLDTLVKVTSDKENYFELKMKPAWADLSIKTNYSDALITINGQQKGFGIINYRGIDFGLKPDVYTLSISKEKYRTYNKTLNLRAGQIENLDVKLEPITGKLGIVSNPPGADVILNGKKVGITPYNSQLIIGDYEVEVVKSGHKEEKYSFQMRDGDYKEYKPELKNYSIALNPLKNKRKFFGYFSIASALAGGYFYYSSVTAYAAYPEATDKAEKLRKQVILGDIMYPTMIGVAVAALIPTISYSVKIRRLKKEWGLVAAPSSNGANLGIAYKF